MKVIVRNFDMRKDCPNPTYEIKIGKMPPFRVYLSDIRSKFRVWILQKPYVELSLKDNQEIVCSFIEEALFGEIKVSDIIKLTSCLKGDIVKRMNGTAKTIQEFNSLMI